jgi:predicted transcriptional regulator
MTERDATWLAAQLDTLRVSPTELARLLHVTPRAVSMWLSGERTVGGPVVAYVELLAGLPRHCQVEELMRLREWIKR